MEQSDPSSYVESEFEDWFVEGLKDFVRVPNLTQMADPEFRTNGLIQTAINVVGQYIQTLQIEGLQRHVFHPEGMNPLIVYVVEPTDASAKYQNIMFYGHLDKQPWGTGWEEGLSPNDPVIRGELMFGRGSSDDGYSAFSTMLAVKSVQDAGHSLPRVVLVLETEEESGSPNLIALLKEAEGVIGQPDACFCMDSGVLDYDQLWLTSSLRGNCVVDLRVDTGKIGFHSGEAGGIVPETFRIVRSLLNRLDDPDTGLVTKDLQVEVPDFKREEARNLVNLYGPKLHAKFELHDDVKVLDHDNLEEMYLNNVWRPNLSITGAEGLPTTACAGNVLRPQTTVRCSMRLCPTFDPKKALEIVTQKLTTNVPHDAKVTIIGPRGGSGWLQKPLQPWLHQAFNEAGQKYFDGKPYASYGEGGSIPFLNELEKKYPDTQIVALGAVGPNSNIHGPNENINLSYAKKVTKTLAYVISKCGQLH